MRSGPLAVSWCPTSALCPAAWAFSTSKRVGNAVARNRLRRRLREAARALAEVPGGNYLVRAQPSATSLPVAALQDHLARAVRALVRGSPPPSAARSPSHHRATKDLGPRDDQPRSN